MSTTPAPGGGTSATTPPHPLAPAGAGRATSAHPTHGARNNGSQDREPPPSSTPRQDDTPQHRPAHQRLYTDDLDNPLWRPDPASLAIEPPEFSHNSGTMRAGPDDLRFLSINVAGNMLAIPAAGHPTPLQRLLHGADHTATDFILMQDTRVTATQAAWFEYLCHPWKVIQSPAPTMATGGCAILCRGHWAARDFSRALFPDGRGLHVEVRGQGMKHLAITNLYCWPGAADETPRVRIQPTSAFNKNQELFNTCAALIGPAVNHGRFLVLGGDLNMMLHADRDRVSPADDGDRAAQDMLRDFTSRLHIAPPPLEPGATAATPWPHTIRVGSATASRLDYLMMPKYHHGASRGVATWAPRSLDTDHSAIMMTFSRKAALGKLANADRRHNQPGARNVTPFLTPAEAGDTWGDETAKLQAQYDCLTARLDDPHPDQDLTHLATSTWHSFVSIHEHVGRRLKPSHFDTRLHKPRWNLKIADADKLHSARHTAMGVYEQEGRRPTPLVILHRTASRLAPAECPPPFRPTRFQSQADVDTAWQQWYSDMKSKYTAQTAEIRRLRIQLSVDRVKAKTSASIDDWRKDPPVQSTA